MNKLKSIIAILLLSLITLSFKAKAQTWDSVGTGMNGGVGAFVVDTVNNILYAGGGFTTAGGVSANNIAKWDGTSWDSLGSGLNSGVQALAIYNDTLYAAGSFTLAGGISAKYIAKWNGTSWDSVGTGMDSDVMTLAVYNNTLYAGGFFSTAGGVSAPTIAKWDGSNWSSVGTGTNLFVLSLAALNTVLYVGGLFTTAGGVSAINIAQWNGTSWDSLGSGLGDPFADQVLAIDSFNGEVYAGGTFINSGAMSIYRIARWNGASWDSVGTGMNFDVESLTNYNNELYAGGLFTTAGGVAANYIAKWNGTNWYPVGTGMNGWVYSLIEYNGELYAGGDFTTAGGINANYIARWNADTCGITSSFTSSATTICEGEIINFTNTSTGAITYEWQQNGTPFSTATDTSRTFNIAGTYSISLIADSGSCSDSSGVIIIVNPTYSFNTPNDTICDGDSVLIGGVYRKTAGIYYDSLTTANSCDSIIATTLIVNPTYSINTPNDTICDGDSVLIGGIYRKTAGTYYDSLTTVNSCDSVIATTLIVNPTYTINTPDETICDGDSVSIFAVYRKIAGTYYDSLTTANSCDSVIATTLIVNPTYTINTPNETICDGDSVSIFAVYRKIAGTYYDSLTTVNSCDSVIATTLIVNSLPTVNLGADTIICNSCSITLDASAGFSSYDWSTGETTPTITVDSTATYIVQITDTNGCSATDSIAVTISTGINNQSTINNNQLKVHPNPNTGEFTVTFNITEKQQINLKIINIKGQIIYQENLTDFTGSYQNKIDMSGYAKGIYNLQLSTKQGTINKKIILE
ncbi:MAG: T9SS type A sorting domain-containing protein [Cytophagales bacterium]|nr:T9SS type A sorting domain-containing protein [Cytophagales bacterium]